jgi:hypothetical protein
MPANAPSAVLLSASEPKQVAFTVVFVVICSVCTAVVVVVLAVVDVVDVVVVVVVVVVCELAAGAINGTAARASAVAAPRTACFAFMKSPSLISADPTRDDPPQCDPHMTSVSP